MQNWVAEHFSDFEGQDKMEEFLDWFEQQLMEDVCPSVWVWVCDMCDLND